VCVRLCAGLDILLPTINLTLLIITTFYNHVSPNNGKHLQHSYDCGILLCRDKEALTSALQSTGAYLHFGNADQERDGMRYTQEMSRRARAVELWAALKYLGRDGVDELMCVYCLPPSASALHFLFSNHLLSPNHPLSPTLPLPACVSTLGMSAFL